MKILTSRPILILLSLLIGAGVGTAMTKNSMQHWSNERWCMEAYQAANAAAELDEQHPAQARQLLLEQMAVALDSFAQNASDHEINENARLLRSLSTYLSVTGPTQLPPAASQLLNRFPPYTPQEAVEVKCTAALCEIAKHPSPHEKMLIDTGER